MSSKVFYFEEKEKKKQLPKLVSQGTQIDPYDFKPTLQTPSLFDNNNNRTTRKPFTKIHSYVYRSIEPSSTYHNNKQHSNTYRSSSYNTHKSNSNLTSYVSSKENVHLFKNRILNKVFKKFNIHKTKITNTKLCVDINNTKIFSINNKPHNTISLKKSNSIKDSLLKKIMNDDQKEKREHFDNIKKIYYNTKRHFQPLIKKVVCIDGENINQNMCKANPMEEEIKSSLSKCFHGMSYKGNSFKVRNLINLSKRNSEISYIFPYIKSLPLL